MGTAVQTMAGMRKARKLGILFYIAMIESSSRNESMPTASLYTDLNIDTPEAARNMELAFQKADRGEINIPEKEVVIVTDPEKMRRFIRG